MRPNAAGPGWGKTLSPQAFSRVQGWCWHSVTVLQPPRLALRGAMGGSEPQHGAATCSMLRQVA